MTLAGKFNLFHLVVQITAAIDVKMDKSAHDKDAGIDFKFWSLHCLYY